VTLLGGKRSPEELIQINAHDCPGLYQAKNQLLHRKGWEMDTRECGRKAAQCRRLAATIVDAGDPARAALLKLAAEYETAAADAAPVGSANGAMRGERAAGKP
jgi:hypothetical protein